MDDGDGALNDSALRPPAAPHRMLVLAACMLAVFMAAVEATIVATAMPTIIARLGGFPLLGWVFAVYLLTQAVSIPVYGRLADLYGRKLVLISGTTLFLVGSTLCGFASSMVGLVLFRALQGLGAGAIVPVATTIAGDISAPDERGHIQGYLSSVWGISAIIGPLLGAFIVQRFSWSFVFWLNLPVGAASMGLLWWCLPESRVRVGHRLDVSGVLLLGTAVVTLLLVLLQGEQLEGWTGPLLLASTLLFGLLIVQERRAVEPLFPLALWRSRVIVAGATGSLVIGAAMMGTSAFLPTYIQGVMGRSALDAGVMLAIMSLSWTLTSMLVGRSLRIISWRAAALAGGGALLLGSLALPMLMPGADLLWARLGAFLIGAGMGMCNTTFIVSVQNSADYSIRGIATASTSFMRMLGSSVGTALLGAVLNRSLAYRLPGVAEPVQALMDPVRRAALPAQEIARIATGVASAMHGVFWAACAFGVAAVLVARLVPRGVK